MNKVTKITKKFGCHFAKQKMVNYLLAKYESGITVAYDTEGKILDKETALNIQGLSDATYTYTTICLRRQELLTIEVT